MTFKHVKFEDSPIMRSLEKVAQEKGLIKPNVLEKIASCPKKLDMTPTSDLMENIFKLCTGLRAQGFTKAATELEVKYLNYKQAQTLYEAHAEKGEDLIEAAHPKGSHHLENVEGDEAVFEDILDKHKKIVDVVNKTPNGKLSESSAVINAVKTVLSEKKNKNFVIGTNFLDVKKGSKVSLGQEESSFSPGRAVAEGAGGLVAYKLLEKIWRALGSAFGRRQVVKMFGTEGVKLFDSAVAKGVGEAKAKDLLLQFVRKAGPKAVTEASEKIGLNFAKEFAELFGQQAAVGEGVAAAGGGAAAIAGEGAAAAGGGAAAVAGEGAAVAGGATVAGEGAGILGSVVSISTSTALAGIAAAIAANVIGYKLFNYYYNATALKEAGNRVLDEAKNMESDFKPAEYRFVYDFNRTLGQILNSYSIINILKSGKQPTKIDLKALSDLDDLIYESRKQVGEIMGYSNAHVDEHWYGNFGGFKSVAMTCANYLKVAEEINASIDDFARQAKAIADKTETEQAGGSQVQQLISGLSKVLDDVRLSKARLQYSKANISNKDQLMTWLDQVVTTTTKSLNEYRNLPDKSDPQITSSFQEDLNDTRRKLDAFKGKYQV
ncbi:MAG TPA: hypothetical protein VII94_04665 [Candidatus Saccharimonadales bacterium]